MNKTQITYFHCLFLMSTKPKGKAGFSYVKHAPSDMQEMHNQIMPYMWTIAINFAVYFAMYRYRKYTMFVHYLLAGAVAILTMVFSLPILISSGISSQPSKTTTHKLIGISIIGIIGLQVILGIASKMLNFCKTSSFLIYLMGKIHAVLGYSLIILCKFQTYYVMDIDAKFELLVAQDCLMAVLIVAKKIFFPNLTASIEPKYNNLTEVKIIQSLKDLQGSSQSQKETQKPEKDYCIFSNYVYDMAPMKLNHPAGYQILNLVRNREIDRFIYGMYRAEKLPLLPASSHSKKSLALLGNPIAKIQIKQPYQNMPNEPFEVKIQSLSTISYNSQIYQIYLSCEQPIKFQGYSCLEQLGRFYSLTVNNKVTRLYTSVNFLEQQNIELLSKIGININTPGTTMGVTHTEIELAAHSDRRTLENIQNKKQLIPLLLKVYPSGTLPNLLINHQAHKIVLSPSKGVGLGLHELQKGTIVIIAGGTGLYPFCDIIDLLYKNYCLQKHPNLAYHIFKVSPILQGKPFSGFLFRLLLACQQLEDIHPITLQQLQELNKSKTFSCSLRISKPPATSYSKIDLTSSKFQDILDSELKKPQSLSKVWLCGSPALNQSICRFFQHNFNNTYLLHIV